MTIEWNLSQLSILVGYKGLIPYIYFRLILSSVCIPLHLRDDHRRLLLIERPFFFCLTINCRLLRAYKIYLDLYLGL